MIAEFGEKSSRKSMGKATKPFIYKAFDSLHDAFHSRMWNVMLK